MNDMTPLEMHEHAQALHTQQMLEHYTRIYFEARHELIASNRGIARLRRRLDRARREAADAVADAVYKARVREGLNNIERLTWAVYGAAAGIGLYKLFA